MKNVSNHRPKKIDPFWNAILAGMIVALIVLNILPSPKIQYLYRVKAVATQQRLSAFQSWIKGQPRKNGAISSSSLTSNSSGFIRFLSAEAIDTTPSSNIPVLTTNQALPQRVLVQITFLSETRYRPNEIQQKLEEISFTECKNHEVQELERQVRLLDWQRTSAEHLAKQLGESESNSLPLLTVSTNPVGSSSLLQDWKGIVDAKKQEQDNLMERLRRATTKAHGFIAVAGKPEVFPRITSAFASSTIIAFAMGVLTTCIIYLFARLGQQAATGRLVRVGSLQKKMRKTSTTDQGYSLAERLAKGGIPILGSIQSTRDASKIESPFFSVATLDEGISKDVAKLSAFGQFQKSPLKPIGLTANADQADRTSSQRGLQSQESDSSAFNRISIAGSMISSPLQRAIEWVLVLWLAIGIMRFLTDDLWRGLFLHSPLTGLAKMLSVLA